MRYIITNSDTVYNLIVIKISFLYVCPSKSSLKQKCIKITFEKTNILLLRFNVLLLLNGKNICTYIIS